MRAVIQLRRPRRAMPLQAGAPGIAIRESCSSSLAHVAYSLLVFIALFSLISCCGLVHPARALAATWPLSVSGSSVQLGFQQTYTAGAKSYVHSGIDVPASAGLQIFSPLAGTVRFTGAVPSGDSRLGQQKSAGATMKAVSVQIADGRTVTLMPFASISVTRGQRVAEGQVLGTLAGSGDASSAGAHLHMGLKEDGVYYDPLSLFGITTGASVRSGAGESGGQPKRHAPSSDVRESDTSAARGVETEKAWAFEGDGVLESDGVHVPERASAQQEEQFGTISSAEVPVQQEEASGAFEELGGMVQAACEPAMRQAGELWGFLGDALRNAGALPGVAAGLLAGILFVAGAIVRKRLPLRMGAALSSRKYPLVARRRE